jgi:C4-type Zn-finger protein
MEVIYQYKDEPKKLICPKCYYDLPAFEMKNGFPHSLNKNIYVTHEWCPNCKVEIEIRWV